MTRLSRGEAVSGGKAGKATGSCLCTLPASSSLEGSHSGGGSGAREKKGVGSWTERGPHRGTGVQARGEGFPSVPFPGERQPLGSLSSRLGSWFPNGQELALTSSGCSEVTTHTQHGNNTHPIWQHT